MTHTFEEVLEKFRQRQSVGNSEATAKRYANCVRRYREWLVDDDKPIWESNYGDVRRNLYQMADDDMADQTMALRLTSISVFWQSLYDMHAEGMDLPDPIPERAEEAATKSDFNITADVDRSDFGLSKGEIENKSHADNGKPHYLTPDEIRALEENVASPGFRNRLIIRGLFTSGMRPGELAQLRIEDIQWQRNRVSVPGIKGSNGRVVPLRESWRDMLAEWLHGGLRDAEWGADESYYLLPSRDGSHLHRDTICRVVRMAAERAGLQEVVGVRSDGRELHKVTGHTPRHSYGRARVRDGVSLRHLQQLMGHDNIKQTELYTELTDDAVIEEALATDFSY